jgi:hypothetical protein
VVDGVGEALGVALGDGEGVGEADGELGVERTEALGVAEPPPALIDLTIITPANTAAPTRTTAAAMIKISRPGELNGPEPSPPPPGGGPPSPPPPPCPNN